MAVVPVGIHPLHIIARAANDPSVLTITERAPTRALSQLEVPASVLNVKVLVGALNQEKDPIVIVKTDGSFAALVLSNSIIFWSQLSPLLQSTFLAQHIDIIP